MKLKSALILSLLIFNLSSCLHTAKVTQKFTAGSSLKPSDVVLFTGYNGKKSRISDRMLKETQESLSQCNIKVVYLHDPNLNYEFLKAGFTPTEADVDNDDFINKMKKVYDITHIFSVASVDHYNGRSMNIEKADLYSGGSGVVFEVYDLKTETPVASMKIKGRTWKVHREDRSIEDHPEGSIYVNYAKGLKTLMKTSACR